MGTRQGAANFRRLAILLGSGGTRRALASGGRQFTLPRTGPRSGQEWIVEENRRKFFADPTLRWYHRSKMTSSKDPDFTHKKTNEALWVDDRLNPVLGTKLGGRVPAPLQKSPYYYNVMLSNYTKKRENKRTLELFHQMEQDGINPDKFTFIPVIRACGGLGAIEEGRRVHRQVIQCGCESDVFVGSCLIDMYAKCGSMEDGWRVFKNLTAKDVVVWSTMIKAYVKCGLGNEALKLFQQMQTERVEPNSVTFMGVLNACANLAAIEEGRSVHAQIIQSGCESDPFVVSSLINMYAKCGSVEDAWRVFNKWPTTDVVSWNAMITGYAKCGQGQKALELYRLMQERGLKPDPSTFKGVLAACAGDDALEDGRVVHMHVIENGCESDIFVASSLVDMYAKCGSIDDALAVFERMPMRDVVSWNTIISGCVKCGQGLKALELHRQMQKRRVKPDSNTFVAILNACTSTGDLEEGRRLHAFVIGSEGESDLFVASSLVDMYSKCGSIEDALRVFDRMPTRDVVVWTSMIKGYVKVGQGLKALELFRQMQTEGIKPDTITFVGALNACANVTALEEGRCIHAQIMESNNECDIFVGNSLIDMYAKCGSIVEASRVFESMTIRDVVSWNALLGGYATHGHVKEALQLFRQMHQEGVKMNSVTFVCLLSACSHGGLVEEGFRYLRSMGPVYDVPATAEHYSCMVDILGRAGRLREAENLLNTMRPEPDVSVWKSLLAACRVHVDIDTGERVANRVLELDPQDASGYVLLSNIYAAAGDWDRSASLQQLRKERGVKEQPGSTWISVNNEMHSFVVDDQTHPQIADIHAELKRLSVALEETGYVPDTRFALHDVEEEENIANLGYHSEKLAIAYGLITTPANTRIRIFKNLRVCGDCHTVIKFISKVMSREIIVRDVNRFHHFKDGLCSCRDYW